MGIADLFLAACVFILTIGAIIYIYDGYIEKYNDRQSFSRLQLSAMQITDMLVRSSGMPADWESNISRTASIGLAYTEGDSRNISASKILAFSNMSYDSTKEIFGTKYDFNFRLVSNNGSVIMQKGSNSTRTRAVGVERRVFFQGEDAIISFVLWE